MRVSARSGSGEFDLMSHHKILDFDPISPRSATPRIARNFPVTDNRRKTKTVYPFCMVKRMRVTAFVLGIIASLATIVVRALQITRVIGPP